MQHLAARRITARPFDRERRKLGHLVALASSPNRHESALAILRAHELRLSLKELGMSILDEALVNSLKTKHPGADLYAIGDDGEEIIARNPSPAEWKAFKAMARDDNKAKALDANAWLVNACALWPEPAAREAIFNRAPALIDAYANKIAENAGARERTASKKL